MEPPNVKDPGVLRFNQSRVTRGKERKIITFSEKVSMKIRKEVQFIYTL